MKFLVIFLFLQAPLFAYSSASCESIFTKLDELKIREALSTGDVGALKKLNISKDFFKTLTDPFFQVILTKDIDMLKYLIEEQGVPVDKNLRAGFGKETALGIAVDRFMDANKHYYIFEDPLIKIIKFLIEKGANVNTVYEKGDTLLHRTVKHYNYLAVNYSKIIPLLLEAGADITAQNSNGETPFEIAQNRYEFDAAMLLAPNTKTRTVVKIKMAIRGGSLRALKEINNAEGEARFRDAIQEIESITQVISWYDFNVDAFKYLVEYGAEIRDTALHDVAGSYVLFATKRKERKILKLIDFLIEKGAVVDAKNFHDETPYDLALRNNNFFIAKHLFKHQESHLQENI